ncbi:hypothetical protein [Embleya sp. NBC_00896]|uniref:hypothetical protein n=1 Tax=Embleya sp. NBC_00896 TaxID=2975961 RepID=UPI00386E90BA|nr:hypothetical protein OG928_01405 [Embleya sp. NBC_00896]
MTAPASFDEALNVLVAAIEDTLALLDPHPTPPTEPAPALEPAPAEGEHLVLALFAYLVPAVDAGVEHALRHAVTRSGRPLAS